MPRVPQQQLGANPVSIPGLPDANLPRTNTAGTLASIIGGGIDVATRAIEFQAAAQQLTNANTINDMRHAEEQARRQAQMAHALAAAEKETAAEQRGAARDLFSQEFPDIAAIVSSGGMDAMIGSVVDDTAVNGMVDDFVGARTAGMSEEASAAFRQEAMEKIKPVVFSRQAKLQEDVIQQGLTDLQSEAVTFSTAKEFTDLVDAKSVLYGKTKAEIVDAVVVPALQARADVGDLSVTELANNLIPDVKIRAALVNKAEATAKINDSNRRLQDLNNFSLAIEAAGTDLSALTRIKGEVFKYQSDPKNADDRATLQSFQNSIDTTIDKISTNAANAMIAQGKADWKSAQVTSAVNMLLNPSLGAIESSSLSESVTMPDGSVRSVEESMSKAEREDMAWTAIEQASARMFPNNPAQQIGYQIDVASQASHLPDAWKHAWSVGVSAADSLELKTADGKDMPIPPQTEAAFALYTSVGAKAPWLLSQAMSYDDRKFYERTISAMRRQPIGGDLRTAMVEAKRSLQTRPTRIDLSGETIVKTMSDVGMSQTFGLFNAASGPNPNWGVVENEVIARADLFADLSPAQAAAKAAKEIEPNMVTINGFPTFLTKPPPSDLKPQFQQSLQTILEETAKARNLNVSDLYISEDPKRGYYRINDRSTLTNIDSIDASGIIAKAAALRTATTIQNQNVQEAIRNAGNNPTTAKITTPSYPGKEFVGWIGDRLGKDGPAWADKMNSEDPRLLKNKK